LKAVLVNRNSVNGFLSHEEERYSVFKRFGHYQKFIHEYFGKNGAQLDDKNYFYARKFKVADRCIAVLGLNSAWMSTCQEEKGQLLIGESQIRYALDKSDDADLRLAVMHHPLEWLRSFDSNDAESLLHEGCDFILQGHMHRTGISLNTTPDTETLVISAGACYETREYPNSYNFVRLDLDTSNFTLYLRMYSDERGGFWTKDVKSYRNVADGIYTRPFWKSLSESLKILKKESMDKPAAAAHQPEASETKIYYGNSYLLKENFAGRVHERKLLSDWLIRDEHQILALTAIGGMGKSALAWAWLHHDVLHKDLSSMLHDTEYDANNCKIPDDKSPKSAFCGLSMNKNQALADSWIGLQAK